MQATIHTVDPQSGAGSVLFDDGREVPFPTSALVGSGLRRVVIGQRISLTCDEGGAIDRMWIVGIGDDQDIV